MRFFKRLDICQMFQAQGNIIQAVQQVLFYNRINFEMERDFLVEMQDNPLFVKIDGRYIRELQHGGRESTFIRHLVRMCAELKVRTIAEMVENAAAEDAVRRAGVDFAQGWLYGAPGEIPVQHPAPVAAVAAARRPAARRVGSVDSWG